MKLEYSLFDSLLEPCFVIDADLKVVYCNETAAGVCGRTVRKAQRATFRELFTFSEPLEWMNAIASVTEPTPYKEVHFTNAAGDGGKVQITCQEIPHDGDRHWIVFVRDVTLEERLQKKYRGELEQKEGYIVELQQAKAELENYSKNLEKMVEERTAEIRQLNALMKALLDSLGQGFFVFDREGRCHDFSSKACETVLEGRPNNRPVWDVLKLPANKVEGFRKWLLTIFADMLPFEDLAPLGPPRFEHSQGREIQLEYFPLIGESGTEGVVVVASDITSLVEAQREAATERENARLILNLVHKRQQIARFVRETRGVLENLSRWLARDPKEWDADEVFRALHTVKGGAASFNVGKTATAAHAAEDALAQYMQTPSADSVQSLREQAARTTAAFTTFLEDSRGVLGAAAFSEERFIEISASDIANLCARVSTLPQGSDLAADLRAKYLDEPIGSFFEPYADVIQKVAEAEGKRVGPLRLENAALKVRSEAYASLFATFVHAFRNAVDHGIEAPSARLEAGKPEEGAIHVEFRHERDRLLIRVQDDGAGIDPARIRAKLARQGVDASAESDEQVIQHVFDSSFSTRDAVTATSGRGVGMDAIKIAAEALGGSCEVVSKKGIGMTLTVTVPWITEPAAATPRAA